MFPGCPSACHPAAVARSLFSGLQTWECDQQHWTHLGPVCPMCCVLNQGLDTECRHTQSFSFQKTLSFITNRGWYAGGQSNNERFQKLTHCSRQGPKKENRADQNSSCKNCWTWKSKTEIGTEGEEDRAYILKGRGGDRCNTLWQDC